MKPMQRNVNGRNGSANCMPSVVIGQCVFLISSAFAPNWPMFHWCCELNGATVRLFHRAEGPNDSGTFSKTYKYEWSKQIHSLTCLPKMLGKLGQKKVSTLCTLYLCGSVGKAKPPFASFPFFSHIYGPICSDSLVPTSLNKDQAENGWKELHCDFGVEIGPVGL